MTLVSIQLLALDFGGMLGASWFEPGYGGGGGGRKQRSTTIVMYRTRRWRWHVKSLKPAAAAPQECIAVPWPFAQVHCSGHHVAKLAQHSATAGPKRGHSKGREKDEELKHRAAASIVLMWLQAVGCRMAAFTSEASARRGKGSDAKRGQD